MTLVIALARRHLWPRSRGCASEEGRMADFQKDFFDATKKAFTILGKDGQVPAPIVDPLAAAEDAKKARVEFNKARQALMKDVDDYENALDKIKNANKQYENTLAKAKFGLDDKKPDDKKKIAEARKVLIKVMNAADAQCNKALKALSDFDRVISSDVEPGP
jgi:hypothetical protein